MGFCSRRETGLNCKYKGKWEFIAKEQGRAGEWGGWSADGRFLGGVIRGKGRLGLHQSCGILAEGRPYDQTSSGDEGG